MYVRTSRPGYLICSQVTYLEKRELENGGLLTYLTLTVPAEAL